MNIRMERCPKCKAERRVIEVGGNLQCVLCDTVLSPCMEAMMESHVGDTIEFGPKQRVVSTEAWKQRGKVLA